MCKSGEILGNIFDGTTCNEQNTLQSVHWNKLENMCRISDWYHTFCFIEKSWQKGNLTFKNLEYYHIQLVAQQESGYHDLKHSLWLAKTHQTKGSTVVNRSLSNWLLGNRKGSTILEVSGNIVGPEMITNTTDLPQSVGNKVSLNREPGGMSQVHLLLRHIRIRQQGCIKSPWC